MLPQWHVQNPGYSAKSAGGKLHLNLHTPLTHLTAVQAECENLLGNELTRNSPGNNRLRSYHLAEPLWTDRGLKSEISLRELISSLKKKKKAQTGNKLSNILPKSSHARKKPPVSYTDLFSCLVFEHASTSLLAWLRSCGKFEL